MRRIAFKSATGLLLLWSLGLAASGQETKDRGKWVSAWSTSVHTPLPFPGLPPTPVFENQTIRMIVRPTLAGQRMRVRLSNAYGSFALEIGSAHVALVAHD
jgi:hypothetical protein